MHLAHNGGETTMAKPLLHHQENRFARFGDDQPIRMQSRRGQTWREQIVLLDHPEHRPLQPRDDPGDEEAGGGAMLDIRTRGGNFVQAGKKKPARWQMCIDSADPKWQRLVRSRARLCRSPFELRDLMPQSREINL